MGSEIDTGPRAKLLAAVQLARAQAAARPLLLMYVVFLAFGVVLVRWSVDLNWDLLNYHISSAYLFFEGGYFEHVHPSGPQHYWPPFVNFLGFFAYELFGLQGGRLALLVVHAALAPACLAMAFIALRVEQPLVIEQRPLLVLIAAFVLGMIAPMTMSILGTTFHDVPMAILCAAAVLAALKQGFQPDLRRGALVAAILAAAVALKLTNLVLAAPFGVVLYAFVLIFAEKKVDALAEAAVFGVTAAVVTIGLMAPWGYYVWQETGSPTFPLLNSVFHSPLVDREFRDLTFVATSVTDFLRTPLEIARGTPMATQEILFRDVRFALFFYLVLPAALIMVFRAGWRTGVARIKAAPVTSFLVAYFVATWTMWDWAFGIHRYIILLDVLVGLLIVRFALFLPGRAAVVAVSILCVAHLATVSRGFWWSQPAPLDGATSISRVTPAFENALVFLEQQPMGYVVAYLDRDSRSVLLGEADHAVLSPRADGPFGPKISALVAREWPGGRWLVTSPNNHANKDPAETLAGHGLAVSPACRPVVTWAETLTACRLEPIASKTNDGPE